MAMEHKAVGVSGLKVLDSPTPGLVRAIVSVTGVKDNVNDIILPGAYEKSLKARTPKGVWHHNWHESVSKTIAIKEIMPGSSDLPATLPDGSPWPEGAGALQVDTQFNLKTTRGKDAYEDVMFFGDDQEWSIGYNVPVGGAMVDSKSGVRKIQTLDLYEYSPVLFGAMPIARTASVKEAQTSYAEIKSLHGEEAGKFLMEVKSILGEDAFTDVEEKAKRKKDDEEDEDGRQIDDSSPQGLLDEQEDDDDEDWEDDDEDEVEGKAFTSAAQSDLIHKAIAALTALLPGASTEDGQEEKSGGEFEIKELADMVNDAGFDQFFEKATEFDAAVEEKDITAMEQAASPILDFVEAMVDFEDSEEVKEIAAYIGEQFKTATGEGDEEDPEAEEDAEPVDDEEEEDPSDESASGTKSIQDTMEKKTISMEDLKKYLGNV